MENRNSPPQILKMNNEKAAHYERFFRVPAFSLGRALAERGFRPQAHLNLITGV